MSVIAGIFYVVGLLAFAVGMITWSNYHRDWRESAAFGAVAFGVVLLLAAIAMTMPKAP